MQRVWVVGNSGSGKSRLGRTLAAALGVSYVELDSIFHQPNWAELPTQLFRARVGAEAAGDGWVIDGNYSVVSDLVLARADTVVFLDLPRSRVMRQLTARTLRRVFLRSELWNGNREPFANLYHPERSIIAWAWANHGKYSDRYRRLMTDPNWAHLEFVRITAASDGEALLARASAGSLP